MNLGHQVLEILTEREDERAHLTRQLADLEKTQPKVGDPTLLDKLPMAGDILDDAPPPRFQQQLYQAFDLQALYKKNMHQVSISVTITDSTFRAVAAIIGAENGTAATVSQPDFSDLAEAPICGFCSQIS